MILGHPNSDTYQDQVKKEGTITLISDIYKASEPPNYINKKGSCDFD